MKIKQMSKFMIIAVALVAVLGIASVSFAAWTGGQTSVTASAQTGVVEVIGFDDTAVTPVADCTTAAGVNKTIVPYDQTTYDATTQVKVFAWTLPDFTVTADYTITVTTTSGLTFYAQLGDARVSEDGLSLTGWERITAAGATFTGEAPTLTGDGVTPVTGKVLSIILDSSNLTDMDQAANFTIALSKTAA